FLHRNHLLLLRLLSHRSITCTGLLCHYFFCIFKIIFILFHVSDYTFRLFHFIMLFSSAHQKFLISQNLYNLTPVKAVLERSAELKRDSATSVHAGGSSV